MCFALDMNSDEFSICCPTATIRKKFLHGISLNGGSSKIAEPYNKRDVGCSIYDAPQIVGEGVPDVTF